MDAWRLPRNLGSPALCVVGTQPPSKRHLEIELKEGMMDETPNSENISTKLNRIANLAKSAPSLEVTREACGGGAVFVEVAPAEHEEREPRGNEVT